MKLVAVFTCDGAMVCGVSSGSVGRASASSAATAVF